MYISNIVQLIVPLLFIFIISIIFSIFSPLGIGFIIFSIIRLKTDKDSLKKVSLVFQIILTSLTFIIGLLISLLFLFEGTPFHVYGSQAWIFMLSVLFGVSFISIIYIAIIVWETKVINRN